MTPQSVATPSSLDLRDLAAEELALRLGWLRECPYHGEPFKTAVPLPTLSELQGGSARTRVDYAADVLALAATLSSGYAADCPFCARENAIPE